MSAPSPLRLPGLSVQLDRLNYHYAGEEGPAGQPHEFTYHLTIQNRSDRSVVLLGRKWVIQPSGGPRLVVEGDGIVGQEPRLAPGEQFSYHSRHFTAVSASAEGSFHGLDEDGRHIYVLIPKFDMPVPGH